jgi:hypothetical protein
LQALMRLSVVVSGNIGIVVNGGFTRNWPLLAVAGHGRGASG